MYRLLLPAAAWIPLALALLPASPAFPAGSAATRQANCAAAKMVAEALGHELDGDNQARQRLLEKAIETAPTADTARWPAGYVRIKRQWVAVDEVPAVMAKDKRLAAYAARRSRSPDTVTGQMALAKWCGKRGLDSRQRAHWARVVQLDPNHIEARRALGHRRSGAEWITPEETKAAAAEARWVARSLQDWSPRLAKQRRLLESRSRRIRTQAEERLRQIHAADAVPAIERVLGNYSETTAQLAIGMLGDIQTPQATQTMARAAVFSPWPPVRREAVYYLNSRKLNSYVPMLLASMATPLRPGMQVARGLRGGLLFRSMAYGERQSRAALAVRDTFLRPAVMPADVDDIQEWRRQVAVARAQVVATRAQQIGVATLQRNRQIDQWNQRIGHVLAATTGVQLPPEPRTWWRWWDDYNEQYSPGPKPVLTTYTYQQENVKPTYRPELKPPPPPPCECLAAGTIVWTAAGAVPIEQVAIGDLVLAQDPQSGQLAYKPVLRTTVRPTEQLVRIALGDRQLHCTGGHPFWVAGSGWTNARALKPGSHLHAITGTTTVHGVADADFRPTYNLIVADFHTYFVGPERVLSHDNTVQTPTSTIVPGLPVGVAVHGPGERQTKRCGRRGARRAPEGLFPTTGSTESMSTWEGRT